MSLYDADSYFSGRGDGAALRERLARARELRMGHGTPPTGGYDALARLYAQAERRMQAEAARLEAADASQYSRIERLRRLAAVKRRNVEVQLRANAWFRGAVPATYIDAYMASVGIRGLQASKVGLINLAAAEALVRDGGADMATALLMAERGLELRNAIIDVTQSAIPGGILDGSGSRKIARDIARRLEQERGFTRFRGPGSRSLSARQLVENLEHVQGRPFVGFRDRGGRPWKLERYSQMVARTRVQQGYRAGTNQYLEDNELDLVRVTIHGATDSCLPFEGAELSAFGRTPGVPTLDQARGSSHLFGPNCKHSYSATSGRFRNAKTKNRIRAANAERDAAIDRTPAQNERAVREKLKAEAEAAA